MSQGGNGNDRAVHFTDRFPPVKTACGTLGPSTGLWRYVTCIPCFNAAPDDPRIRELREDAVEARNARAQPEDPAVKAAQEVYERLIAKPETMPVKLHRWADIKKARFTPTQVEQIDREVAREVRRTPS